MVDKNTKLTDLLLDYPDLVKIFKPYTFEYLTNDRLTIEDVAKNNKLDVEGFVEETKELLSDEPDRNLSEKSADDLARMVDETYFEDLLDELPVLDIYVKKFITGKDTTSKETQEKFTILRECAERYIDFSQHTLHPLLKETDKNKKAIQAEVKQRNLMKDKLLESLRDLREKTSHYVAVDDKGDIQFLYHRMSSIEDTLLDMVLVEDKIYEKATE